MKPPVAPTAAKVSGMPVRVSVSEGYRLWSQTYDFEPNPLLALEFRILTGKLLPLKGKVFLDVGCGTGRWMAYAASMGAKPVGVDLSFEMLSAARLKVQLGGRLIRAHGCDLPLPDQFADLVISSFSVGYTDCLGRQLQELNRVARRGARIVVSDLHPRACQLGWRRSFRYKSQVYEIEHRCYAVDQLLEAGRTAGMTLRDVLEPHFGEPEYRTMREAGKAGSIDEVSSVPAVLAVEWEAS